jgi:hypothetical protein
VIDKDFDSRGAVKIIPPMVVGFCSWPNAAAELRILSLPMLMHKPLSGDKMSFKKNDNYKMGSSTSTKWQQHWQQRQRIQSSTSSSSPTTNIGLAQQQQPQRQHQHSTSRKADR